MRNFIILTKGRKYFKAKLENKYNCKILIDDNSEALSLGDHQLEVEDISVKSKYGTDLIFRLSSSIDEMKTAGICTLRAPFNIYLVESCRNLGGKWDYDEKAWVFSSLVESQVEELDVKYNSNLIGIEVLVLKDYYEVKNPIYIAGFEIARAFSRDSGAKLANGIAIIEGNNPYSCGSHKNWATEIKKGTRFRMSIPENCINDIDNKYFKVTKI